MLKCIVCEKKMKLLEWGENHKESPLPEENIDDGCTLQIHRAYGSCHDVSGPNSDLYYSVICDDCIGRRLKDKTIKKFKYIKPASGTWKEVN